MSINTWNIPHEKTQMPLEAISTWSSWAWARTCPSCEWVVHHCPLSFHKDNQSQSFENLHNCSKSLASFHLTWDVLNIFLYCFFYPKTLLPYLRAMYLCQALFTSSWSKLVKSSSLGSSSRASSIEAHSTTWLEAPSKSCEPPKLRVLHKVEAHIHNSIGGSQQIAATL